MVLIKAFFLLSVPELPKGKKLSASVFELSPWVEYEFRVLATNSIGTGEPSKPSKKARTKETGMCQNLPVLCSAAQHLMGQKHAWMDKETITKEKNVCSIYSSTRQ